MSIATKVPGFLWWIIWILVAVLVILLVALAIHYLGGFDLVLRIGHFHFNVGVS